MKKRMLSLALALALLCAVSLPVFAADATGSGEQLEKTTNYLMTYVEEMGGPTYLHDTATLYIARSGVKSDRADAYLDAYLASLKDALDENGGKLFAYGAESPVCYANGAAILAALDLDPTNFYGYDLIQNIRGFDRDTLLQKDCITLSYVLMTFSQFAGESDAALVNDMIDAILASYKETDTAVGFDYWGIGADNNQRCVTALLPFVSAREDVKNAVEKSVAWTVSKIDENGFLHDSYSDAANADSTGRGLAMFAAAGEMEAADTVYSAVLTLALDNGAFVYLPGDTDENGYATGDVYEGLVNYARVKAGKTALNNLSDTAYFRAENVKTRIAAIADTVTLEDQESIAAIRAAYDALPESFQSKIGDISKLTASEKTIADLLAVQEPAAPNTPDGSNNPNTGDQNAAAPVLLICCVSALAAYVLRRRLVR